MFSHTRLCRSKFVVEAGYEWLLPTAEWNALMHATHGNMQDEARCGDKRKQAPVDGNQQRPRQRPCVNRQLEEGQVHSFGIRVYY